MNSVVDGWEGVSKCKYGITECVPKTAAPSGMEDISAIFHRGKRKRKRIRQR